MLTPFVLYRPFPPTDPPSGPIPRYELPQILAFVRAVTGESLHLSEDVDGSVYGTVNHAGYRTAWHFDQHPYSAAIVLQEPASGGAFEWVNDARRGGVAATDERVATLLAGGLAVNSSRPTAGTFSLFRGEDTLHQVSQPGSTPLYLGILVLAPWLHYHPTPVVPAGFYSSVP